MEKDPTKLATIQEGMRAIFGTDEIQKYQTPWKAVAKSE